MWLLQGTFTFALLLAVDALESCSPKSCKIGLVTRKAACGSDGFSYYNRCHLEMARCHNKNLTFAHRGACRAQKSCRDYLKAYPGYTFKPQCRSDGNYSAGQCNADFGYCWCVTAQGTPIPFSATRMKPGGKHRCGKAKKTTRSSSTKQRKNQRACNRDDKAIFNSNLLKIFTTEWGRETSSKSTATDKVVLDWKFNLMDLNHDDMLDKTEYRDLRRLMKKVVKPKRCAKSFAKACDMNRDQVIGRQEWAQCLTRDGMDDVKGAEDGPNPDEDEDDDDEEEYFKGSFPPSSILTDMPRPLNGGPNYDDESTEKKDDDATDCLSDRKVALDEDSQLYVPECTADGRYAKVQCYKSAGYCWCVNEDTGKNIPGTAVKDQVPKCDQIASSSRPMKGCPEDKKIAFLKDLMEYLHASMIKETNGTSIIGAASSSSWRSSKEEQIASWSFVFFDKNKNKQLDKVEWKGFKDKMVTVKSLKRCGKKLPRYCDINKDRHISMTEWLDCLNTHRYQEQIDSSTLPSSTKSGKNPLSLLMED